MDIDTADRQELDKFYHYIQTITGKDEAARAEALKQWKDAIKEPSVLVDAVARVFDGGYSRGAQLMGRMIMEKGEHTDKVMRLYQLIAALEWGCPYNEARRGWAEAEHKAKVAARQAIQDYISNN